MKEEPIFPCTSCIVGWGNANSNGTMTSCSDGCIMLRYYNKKQQYNKIVDNLIIKHKGALDKLAKI